jgi:GTP cyclohydrolase I
MLPTELTHLKDTQNEPDHRNIPIDRVGVRSLRYPMRIRDKAHMEQHTIASVTLTVDLPEHFKGTHMSRFVEALNDCGAELHIDRVRDLLRVLTERLHAQCAHVEFTFPFFIEKAAPVSGKKGLLDYNVNFNATLQRGAFDFVTTVIVPVATLCPCSKSISERGAHNQRGEVTFAVRSSQPVWVEDLIQLVEQSASCELFSVLKRPDEKAVTERAYDNPVFVEDLVRNVATRANLEDAILWYRVEAENFESIHNHNAYALVEHTKPTNTNSPVV